MTPRRSLGVLIYGCGSSIFFTTLGILFLSLWSVIYEAILRNNLILIPGRTTYEFWEKTPMPISLKLFLFNWTNPEEIYNSSSKPNFQEIGPFYYTETKEKVNIVFNSNNTVTYKNVKRWWFEPELSNGNLGDLFVTVNPVGVSAAYAARDWHYILKKGVSLSLNTIMKSIHLSQPVGKVLFDGYSDPLLSMATKLPMLESSKLPFTDKFGWFYGRNGSAEFDGVFNMNTGVKGQIGELKSWRYMNATPYFPGHCTRYDGASAGDFFPKELTKNTVVRII